METEKAPGAPIAIMLAGPNGAGKTTTAMSLFRETMRSVEFVNADIIAQGLAGTHPDSVALDAAAVMLERLHALAEKKVSFAFETTGASRSFAPWLKNLKSDGYEFRFFFFWLRNADFAIGRVAERVRLGGHHVPEDRIRSRYEGGLRNFFNLYLPIATQWQLIDNNGVARIIATGGEGLDTRIGDAMLWNKLKSRYSK